MTYADLSFVAWNDRIDSIMQCGADEKFAGFPRAQAWHERMTALPSWKRAMEKKDALMKEQGLEIGTGRPSGYKSHQEYEAAIAAGTVKSAT